MGGGKVHNPTISADKFSKSLFFFFFIDNFSQSIFIYSLLFKKAKTIKTVKKAYPYTWNTLAQWLSSSHLLSPLFITLHLHLPEFPLSLVSTITVFKCLDSSCSCATAFSEEFSTSFICVVSLPYKKLAFQIVIALSQISWSFFFFVCWVYGRKIEIFFWVWVAFDLGAEER